LITKCQCLHPVKGNAPNAGFMRRGDEGTPALLLHSLSLSSKVNSKFSKASAICAKMARASAAAASSACFQVPAAHLRQSAICSRHPSIMPPATLARPDDAIHRPASGRDGRHRRRSAAWRRARRVCGRNGVWMMARGLGSDAKLMSPPSRGHPMFRGWSE